ncbi:chorismate mutase [soil metagenome]
MAEERAVKRIDELRQRIDEIDTELVALLNSRAACALAIGRAKKAAGLDLYQPLREADVLSHVQRINGGPLDNGAIRRLFERVIDEARRLERLGDVE